LLDEAVSAGTVSNVCKMLDGAVEAYHRRELADHYEYLLVNDNYSFPPATIKTFQWAWVNSFILSLVLDHDGSPFGGTESLAR
jgi:hypothetical protein